MHYIVPSREGILSFSDIVGQFKVQSACTDTKFHLTYLWIGRNSDLEEFSIRQTLTFVLKCSDCKFKCDGLINMHYCTVGLKATSC